MKSNAAQLAAEQYRARVAEIRLTMDRGSREYAAAMSAASLAYERAMVADIGAAAASRKGAGMRRL